MSPTASLNLPRGSRANLMSQAAARLQTAFHGRWMAAQARYRELLAGGAFVAPFGCGLAGRQAELGLAEPLRPTVDAAEAG